MVNITCFELEDWEAEIIKKEFKQHKLLFFKESLSKEHLPKIKSTEILIVFVNSIVDKEILKHLPKLKFIVTTSTGYDHIDLSECKKRKIPVSNVPEYGTNTVAEHTFALILSISRNLYSGIERSRQCSFDLTGLRGFDLRGKTLGVVGTGKIGKYVTRIAKGFEMKILAYDLYPDKEFAKKYEVKYVKNFTELLKNSDIITLHTILNESTHHLINKKNIKFIKKGAVLINTARGGLVETEAMDEALHNGTLRAAGIDVLEEEITLKEEKELLSTPEKFKVLKCDWHLLLQHKNVFVTPHNAFNSEESVQRIMQTTVENVEGFLTKKPLNLVK
ncbi:hydroxyacid dehydrogenase [Candidatus Woesearchaeota archaeon]|nr:hydroxyacid dehydrogenase [Candidatus Woesearchaeota archaeon]